MTLIRGVFNFILGGKHNYKRIELILNKQQYLLMKKERDCGCGGSFRTHITCVSMHEGVNTSPCASFFFQNLLPFYLIFYFLSSPHCDYVCPTSLIGAGSYTTINLHYYSFKSFEVRTLDRKSVV